MTPTEIAFILKKKNIQWNIKDELVTPTAEHVEQVLHEATTALRETPDTGDSAVYYERGGLIVRKMHSHIDAFVFAGEIV